MNSQQVVKTGQSPQVTITRDQLIDQICAQRGTQFKTLRRVKAAK